MATPAPSTHAVFMQFAGAKFGTRALYWAGRLGLGDHLADGPLAAAELARRTETREDALYRLLRALSAIGILSELADRRFELTPVGAHLKSGPGSLRHILLWLNDPRHDRAWDELPHALKSDETGAQKAYGMPIFEYLRQEQDLGAIFNAAMTDLATGMVRALLATYDFSGLASLVDVGGGHGALLSAVLGAHPRLRGTIFDLPQVIEGPHGTRARLAASGLAGRCDAVAGDFFTSVAGGDAIIMSHIIHDWNDEQAAVILKNCRRALPPGGRVLVVESLVPGPNAFSVSKLLDLEMLVMVGGRERTEAEFRRLFSSAGLTLDRIIPLPSGHSVLEAQPA